jgi:hypothetical protein
MASQLTVRVVDEQLEARIRDLAEREGLSLNQAVLRLLRKGAGLEERPRQDAVGSSLDALIGSWSEREAEEVDRYVRELDAVEDDPAS